MSLSRSLCAGALTGVPSATKAVQSHDSELINRCESFCAALAEHNARAYKASRDGLDIPIWTGRSTRRLMDQIIAIRAASPAGLKAKISVVEAYQDQFVHLTDMTPDRRLAASIFADLLAE